MQPLPTRFARQSMGKATLVVSILACAWTVVGIHLDVTAIGDVRAHATSQEGSRVGTQIQMDITADAQTRALEGNDGEDDGSRTRNPKDFSAFIKWGEPRNCCKPFMCRKFCECVKVGMKVVQQKTNKCKCGKRVRWHEAKKCEDVVRKLCDGGKCCANDLLHRFAEFKYPYVILPCKYFSASQSKSKSSLVDVDQQKESQKQQGEGSPPQNESQNVAMTQRRDQVGIAQHLDQGVTGMMENAMKGRSTSNSSNTVGTDVDLAVKGKCGSNEV